jgi:hypothetical protein
LYSNYIDLFSKSELNAKIIYCLDSEDEEYLPKNFFPQNTSYLFLNASSPNEVYSVLNSKFFDSFKNNLMIRYSAIGISGKDLNKVFNLLSIEDEAIVIGKSQNESNIFLGMNNIIPDVIKKFLMRNLDYNKYLAQISSKDIFLNVIKGYLEIKTFDDFKLLYEELTKKESLNYCSEVMHERFTDLFVEYKELLNE